MTPNESAWVSLDSSTNNHASSSPNLSETWALALYIVPGLQSGSSLETKGERRSGRSRLESGWPDLRSKKPLGWCVQISVWSNWCFFFFFCYFSFCLFFFSLPPCRSSVATWKETFCEGPLKQGVYHHHQPLRMHYDWVEVEVEVGVVEGEAFSMVSFSTPCSRDSHSTLPHPPPYTSAYTHTCTVHNTRAQSHKRTHTSKSLSCKGSGNTHSHNKMSD